MNLQPETLKARQLKRTNNDVSFVTALDVEERIADAYRDLVPKLRGALRVTEDQYVAHVATLTSNAWWPQRGSLREW